MIFRSVVHFNALTSLRKPLFTFRETFTRPTASVRRPARRTSLGRARRPAQLLLPRPRLACRAAWPPRPPLPSRWPRAARPPRPLPQPRRTRSRCWCRSRAGPGTAPPGRHTSNRHRRLDPPPFRSPAPGRAARPPRPLPWPQPRPGSAAFAGSVAAPRPPLAAAPSANAACCCTAPAPGTARW